MYYVNLSLGDRSVNAKLENIHVDDFLEWVSQVKSQDDSVKVNPLDPNEFSRLSKNRKVSQKRMFRKISSKRKQYYGTMTSYQCDSKS